MKIRPLFAALVVLASTGTLIAKDSVAKANFGQELNALVAASGLKAGFAIKDLVTGDEFVHLGDTSFPLGSSIRIHLVAELFRQHAAGRLSVSEVRKMPESLRVGGYGVLRFLDPNVALTLRDYAVLTITINDNSAANVLADVVGLENVNASLASQGTPEIKFGRMIAGPRATADDYMQNVGPPRAVMRALELIHRGEVVDRATSDAILAVLALPETSFFRRGLPRGVQFAGRSGSGPTFRCDAGIVLLKEHPYVFCLMLDGLAATPQKRQQEYARADELIVRMSRAALAYFNDATPRKSGRDSR